MRDPRLPFHGAPAWFERQEQDFAAKCVINVLPLAVAFH